MSQDTPVRRATTGLTVTLMALAVFCAVAGIDLYGFFWPTVAALLFSWIAHYLLEFVYVRQLHRTPDEGTKPAQALPDPPQKS